jgi:DNA-directed RNA polymerase beta subunit
MMMQTVPHGFEHDASGCALINALKHPIVGTGIEEPVAQDSRVLIHAEGDGEVVEFVDSSKITIRYNRAEEENL